MKVSSTFLCDIFCFSRVNVVMLHQKFLLFFLVLHYWRLPLCRGPEALGKGPLTLGKGFAEAALGKELSGNFESAKRVFAEDPLSGTRQTLCRGLERHSAKKSSRHSAGAWDGVFAEGRLRGPSAKNYSFF